MLKCVGTYNCCEECGTRMLVDLALCADCREDYDTTDCLEDRIEELTEEE